MLFFRCTVSTITCFFDFNSLCEKLRSCTNGRSPCVVGCPTHFQCQNKSNCVARNTICDGKMESGCVEEDEYKGGIGFKCKRKGEENCRIPQQLLWDNINDCDEGADLCYSNPFKSLQTAR